MKNLKCFVWVLVFTVLFFLIIPHNLFAIVPKFNPVKSAAEEVLGIFLMAESEFKKGQVFQNKHDYEKALSVYKHISSFSMDEVTRNFIDLKIENIENNISYYSP